MGNDRRADATVVCIGGANVDRKARCMGPARLRTSNPVRMSETRGGVARNVAENLGRLGCGPLLISCVGDDGDGERLLAETSAQGVNVRAALRVAGARTGTYTAVLEPSGELVIALNEMEVAELLTPAAVDARWEHLAAARLIFADTNLPPETLAYLIERCGREGLLLVVDPVSAIKAQRLPKRLDGVSAILPDQLEAEALAGMGAPSDGAWEPLAARIRARGAQAVVISLGERGLYYTADDTAFERPSVARAGDVVDVTGAGDALAAGFLFGLLRGETAERCCELGLAAAALTVRSAHSVAPELTPRALEG